MVGRLDEFSNLEFMGRDTSQPIQSDTPQGVLYGGGEANELHFEFIGRFAYQAPPTTGVDFPLFTITQTITRGMIVEFGIATPQFDFFGTNMYYLAVNGSAPYNQQYQIVSGPPTGAGAGGFFGFCPVGSVNTPHKLRVTVKTNDNVSLRIAPQATPAAGVVVYNLFVRVAVNLVR